MMTSAILFLQAALARSYARIVWLKRNRIWLVQETILPILAVAAFAYCYRAFGAPEQFVGYVLLGAALAAFWFNVLWSMGAHLYWERDNGNLELYILSPAPLMGILAGMALGGLATTTVRAAAILACGAAIFQVPIDLSRWPLALTALLLTLIALYGMGMMFASLFLLWGREAWHVANLLQEPVFLLSGQNFPVRLFLNLPLVILGAALLIPLTAGMDALRQLLLPVPDGGLFRIEIELLLLALLGILFVLLARWLLDAVERQARAQGRLTVRWQ